MKKLFVAAIMAIALIAGSVTTYADNCKGQKCDKAKTECVKGECKKDAKCDKAQKCEKAEK